MDFYLFDFLWHIVLSSLFIVGTYSLAIGVKAKQKSFFYYTVYSYLLLIYIVLRSPYFSDDFKNTLRTTDLNILFWLIQVLYNSAYFYFFSSFLQVKKHLPQLDRFIKWFIPSIIGLAVILAVISFLVSFKVFKMAFIFGFSPIMGILGFYILFRLKEIPGKLKYFFFVGSSVYLVGALVALGSSALEKFLGVVFFMSPMSIYYASVFIEQMAFGFGLSQKVQIINKERIDLSFKNQEMNRNMNKKLQKKLAKREKQIAKAIKEVQENRIEKIKLNYENQINDLKLQTLQSQINPHFIFNALNSIKSSLIDNDQKQAIIYMDQFSSLLRKVLVSSKKEFITLKEELDVVENYILVENSRLDQAVKYSISELDANLLNLKVPPLILQPLVENAIWHGLAPVINNERKLKIYCNTENNHLVIEDNGIGLKQAQNNNATRKIKRKSIGLDNIRERLVYFNKEFGKKYTLVLQEKIESPGTKAIIKL